MTTMMNYQTNSPARRYSMLDVSLAPKWRPRSASMSVVDVSNFSSHIGGIMNRRPATPCTTPCFVSPRMAFTSQFSYDSPIQVLSSSPRALSKLHKFSLRNLSHRCQMLLILVFLGLAATLFLVRTISESKQHNTNLVEVCAEDDLSCLGGETATHEHPRLQRFMRAVAQPPTLDSLSTDPEDAELDTSREERLSQTLESNSSETVTEYQSEYLPDGDAGELQPLPSVGNVAASSRKQRLPVIQGEYSDNTQQYPVHGNDFTSPAQHLTIDHTNYLEHPTLQGVESSMVQYYGETEEPRLIDGQLNFEVDSESRYFKDETKYATKEYENLDSRYNLKLMQDNTLQLSEDNRAKDSNQRQHNALRETLVREPQIEWEWRQPTANSYPMDSPQWEGYSREALRLNFEESRALADQQQQRRSTRFVTEERPRRLQEKLAQEHLQSLQGQQRIRPVYSPEEWREASGRQVHFRIPPGVNPARYTRHEL